MVDGLLRVLVGRLFRQMCNVQGTGRCLEALFFVSISSFPGRPVATVKGSSRNMMTNTLTSAATHIGWVCFVFVLYFLVFTGLDFRFGDGIILQVWIFRFVWGRNEDSQELLL